MAWREVHGGEDFWWPLHPERQEDHLRVWLTQGLAPLFTREQMPDELQGWRGAVVIDGEYLEPTRVGPFPTREDARRAVIAAARAYLGTLVRSLEEAVKG